MNNGLSQLGRQLATIWSQLGLNQRVSICLTGTIVLASLITLGYWSSKTDFALLYGRLDETEAAKVIAALDEANIPYQAQHGGSILVPSHKVHQTRMQLAGKGIPRGEGVGFEIFDKPNFGISDFVQRANYTRAIQGELARTISQLDQVDTARVMIVLPENRLLLDTQKRPTASVFVRVRGNSELPQSAVNSIRLLVANAVEGLQVNHVSVVDNHGNVLSDNQDDSLLATGNHQLATRKNLELYLARKAEGMLETVLGPGQAVVRVSADINWDTLNRYEEKFDPEGQVIRSSLINDENVDTPSSPGGIPGVSSNSSTDTNNATLPSPSNAHTKRKITNNQYEINRTISNLIQNPGSLSRISAAVFVAQSTTGSPPDLQPAPRSPEDLEKLRRIVQSALGIIHNDPSKNDLVTLEEMPFSDTPTSDSANPLDHHQSVQFWFDLAQRFTLPLLSLALLFAFYRAFKRLRPDDASLALPLGNIPRDNDRPLPLSNSPSPTPGIVTVEVLNQLIRDNPASMTHAVRAWMNRGNSPQ